MNKLRIGAVLVALLATMIGCGAAGTRETAKVKGNVTLDGQALTEGGTVLFEPERGGKMAAGIIQPDGSFELTTYREGDGAIVGRHRIAIMPVTKFVSDKDQNMESDQKSSIPYKYRATSSSGFEFEVKSGETNDCRLALSGKTK